MKFISQNNDATLLAYIKYKIQAINEFKVKQHVPIYFFQYISDLGMLRFMNLKLESSTHLPAIGAENKFFFVLFVNMFLFKLIAIKNLHYH